MNAKVRGGGTEGHLVACCTTETSTCFSNSLMRNYVNQVLKKKHFYII